MTASISDTFYLPEIRDGYYVPSTMKKIWAIELDLLKKFSEVCESNGLCYFMDGGTLLGSVRHKGFIPWDDDADVIMPRKDYDKLWEIASEEFTEPYFFQTTLSEDGFFRPHAQLRNSQTTGFIKSDQNKNINKGIFIDIFVLDNVPDSIIKKNILHGKIELEKKILAYQYDAVYEKLSIKGKLLYKLVHLFFAVYPFKKFFNHFNRKTLGKYRNVHTKLAGDITLAWRTNVQWEREWFEDYVYLPFEHLMLRAPSFYKEVLSRQYGNYMEIPTDVEAPNGRSHEHIIFDPDVPYKEYFQKLYTEE